MKEEFFTGHTDMHDFSLQGEGFLYCEQGEATVVLEFQKYQLKKGTILFLAPDLYPHFEGQSADFGAFFFIGTDSFLEKVQYGLPSEFYDHVYTHPLLACDDNLLALLHLIENYNGIEAQASRHLILTDLVHAFFLAYEMKIMKNYEIDRGACPAHIERQCRHFYLLVQERFREHRDVGYYANELCLSPNYLAVIIRKYCRESPKLAITRQTISEIKYQLIYTSKSIDRIAKELNFADSSYMCRYFRRATGQALEEYRKAMK